MVLDKKDSVHSIVKSIMVDVCLHQAAYLRPAMKRKNLTVKTRAFVTELHFEGNKATGVTFKRNGKIIL